MNDSNVRCKGQFVDKSRNTLESTPEQQSVSMHKHRTYVTNCKQTLKDNGHGVDKHSIKLTSMPTEMSPETRDNNHISQFPKINNIQSPLLKNYVQMKLHTMKAHAMVDSGSDISVAHPRVLSKFHLNKLCTVGSSDKRYIVTANNEMSEIDGVVRVPVEIGKVQMHVKFYLVPELHTDFILGLDFLNSNNATLDFAKGTLSLDPRRNIVASESFTIPPNSEQVVVARIKGMSLPSGIVGITQASPNIHSQGLLAAKVLAKTDENNVYQRLCNLSDQPVFVKKGTPVGKFVCVSAEDTFSPLPDNDNVDLKSPKQSQCQTTPTKFIPFDHLDFSGTDLTTKQRNDIQSVVNSYSDIFVSHDNKLGKCEIIKHEIKVDPYQQPIRQRAYRVGPKQREAMDSILDDLIDQHIIEESISPWGAPCLLVQKKNNAGFRMVVDYRKLNKCLSLDAHPLPTPAESLDSIGANSPGYFTALDLASGFNQIVIDERSRPYTAFRTHRGLFQYTRLPQGLRNSPATFQRVMEACLRGLNYKMCLIYMDDVIIFSRTFDEHLKHIQQVFDCLRRANLKLKPNKCFFARRKIHYLGHIVSQHGIEPDPDKVSAVKDYPTPRNVKDLRSFLGLSGYYRKFIKGYSGIAAPLYALTKKDVKLIGHQTVSRLLTD